MAELYNILKIGQLVHIELPNKAGFSERYASRVENISEDELVLASPIYNRVPLHLPTDSVLNIWFWDNVAIYTFRTTVITNKFEKIPLLFLRNPVSIERVQNREYVRVQCLLNVMLRYENPEGVCQELWCRTRDLSGGGMMLVLSKPVHLKENSEAYLQFQLGDDLIRSMGTVIWKDWELDSEGIERLILGVKFTTISNRDRQLVVKFVYQKQIELRRKGLL